MKYFVNIKLKQLIIRKSILYKTLFVVTIFIFTFHLAQCQKDYKKIINDKYSNIKKKISNDSIIVKGQIKATTGFRTISSQNSKPFEYRISANLKLSYRGLDIPIAYTFSNGRSLYRINGPNYNLPKINNLGISPKYKWATLHLGTRSMSFSKYTYDNLRFKGVGIELTPGNTFIKAFKGKLLQTTQQEDRFLNNFDNRYAREAFGTQFGYKNENSEYSLIVFKASDDLNSIESGVSPPTFLKAKENAVIGLHLNQTLFKDFEVRLDRTVSAYTRDLEANRVDIKTHGTVYNMLGLYEKKESSVYAYASKLSLLYKKENSNYSLNYEEIDNGFRSLGSLLFDNNFRSYTLGMSKPITKKLNVSSEIGFREDGIASENQTLQKKIIGNISANYVFNDYILSNANYSNFRNTQKTYFQSINSFYADSVFISLVNSNLNLSTTFFVSKDKTKNLTLLYSNQISNQVQEDSIVRNFNTQTNLWSLNFAMTTDKWNMGSSLTYLRNNTQAGLVTSKVTSMNLAYIMNEKMRLNNTVSLNFINTAFQDNVTLLIKNDYVYNISKMQQLSLANKMNFANRPNRFRLFDQIIEVDYQLRF